MKYANQKLTNHSSRKAVISFWLVSLEGHFVESKFVGYWDYSFFFPDSTMVVLEEVFGQTESGEDVIKYTIKNSNKHELCVISLGATLVSLKCPDR